MGDRFEAIRRGTRIVVKSNVMSSEPSSKNNYFDALEENNSLPLVFSQKVW